MERARGRARIVAAGAPSALAGLRQEGSARLLLPRRSPGAPLEAVVVNVGGGLADGDRFRIEAEAEDGATLRLTTQACEKVYRSRATRDDAGVPPARADARLRVGEGATLHWLPQETILFPGARLRRRLDIALEASARLVAVEAVLLGRPAGGEAWDAGRLEDSWRVRRAGRLVFADALRLEPDALSPRATLAGAGAFATLLLAAPDAEARLGRLRAALGIGASSPVPDEAGDFDAGPLDVRPEASVEGVDAGASAFDGLLLARLVARDGLSLRRALLRALPVLTDAPPPAAWGL